MPEQDAVVVRLQEAIHAVAQAVLNDAPTILRALRRLDGDYAVDIAVEIEEALAEWHEASDALIESATLVPICAANNDDIVAECLADLGVKPWTPEEADAAIRGEPGRVLDEMAAKLREEFQIRCERDCRS